MTAQNQYSPRNVRVIEKIDNLCRLKDDETEEW